jgi:hypothetical protein
MIKDTKKRKGVMVIDAETNETMSFMPKLFFVNASIRINFHLIEFNQKHIKWDG